MITATDFWTADRGAGAGAWVDHYWDSADAPYRDEIVRIVGDVLPRGQSHRLLEIGCHCGPNLRRFLARYPRLVALGVDCNAEAIREGRWRLEEEGYGRRIELRTGLFPEATRHLPAACVDVALTCYMLAYVPASGIDDAVAELCRLARAAVVLVERHGAGHGVQHGDYQEWRHDYAAVCRRVVQQRRWREVPIAGAHWSDRAIVIGPLELATTPARG